MTAFAGIDYDTFGIHAVLIHEDDPCPAYYFHWSLGVLKGAADAFDRTRRVREAMPSRGWWRDQGVVAAGIEEPAGRNVGYAFRVQGAVLACLPQDLLVEKFMPSQWRKANGIAGNAPKTAVSYAVSLLLLAKSEDRLPSGWPWPQDACDAYCLALAVQKLAVVETSGEAY